MSDVKVPLKDNNEQLADFVEFLHLLFQKAGLQYFEVVDTLIGMDYIADTDDDIIFGLSYGVRLSIKFEFDLVSLLDSIYPHISCRIDDSHWGSPYFADFKVNAAYWREHKGELYDSKTSKCYLSAANEKRLKYIFWHKGNAPWVNGELPADMIPCDDFEKRPDSNLANAVYAHIKHWIKLFEDKGYVFTRNQRLCMFTPHELKVLEVCEDIYLHKKKYRLNMQEIVDQEFDNIYKIEKHA